MENERDHLTPEERALIESGAEPDLPSGMPPLAALLQSVSSQLQPGNDDFVEGACQGDLLVPCDGVYTLIKGSTGIPFVPVGFETQWPQFRPFRQGWAGVTHAERPVNALWLYPEKRHDRPASPDGKQGLYLIDADGKPGDKIEETLYLHALVLPGDGRPPHGVSFSFHSTSLVIGKDFSKRAGRVQAEIDGKPVKGYVVGKWRLSSEYKKSDRADGKGPGYYRPVTSPVGKVGEDCGPTIAEMLQAAGLRANFRARLGVTSEVDTISTSRPAITITSGRQPPVPPAPPSDGPPVPPPHPGPDEGPDKGPGDEGRDYTGYDF